MTAEWAEARTQWADFLPWLLASCEALAKLSNLAETVFICRLIRVVTFRDDNEHQVSGPGTTQKRRQESKGI